MKGLILSICALIGVIATAVPTRSSVSAHNIGMLREERSNYTASDYIQDGLIAMWDGIENAEWGTHAPNATTWKDLIGSLDFSLTEYGYFDSNSFVSNLPNNPSNGTYAAIINSSTSVLCIQAAFRTTSIKTDYQGAWMFTVSSGKGVGFCTQGHASFPQYLYKSPLFRKAYPSSFPIGLSPVSDMFAPMSISATYDSEGSVSGGYVNGAESQVMSGVANSSFESSKIVIGSDRFSRWWNGHIYSIRLYNRALSAAEIATNYAIDVQRFNLKTKE